MKKILFMFFLLSGLVAGAEPVAKPLALYLKNLPQERIGEWTDAQIKADLESKGFIFVEHDCSSYPKDPEGLRLALVDFYTEFGNELTKYETAEVTVDTKAVFCVPEGYTVTPDIPIWNIADHGAEGSLEKIVKTWNDYIVKDYGVEPVTSVDQMYGKDGKPVDLNLYLDIVHPSGKASKNVPLLFNFSSADRRMSAFRPETGRNGIPLGFLTTGYAFASADHCYNPLAKAHVWKYYEWYSLEDWNGLKSAQAYIRYLRTHLEEYNLDGRIGTMGISKASYSSTRMADPHNASGSEHFLFNGVVNTKPQPWADGESHVDVIYTAAGHGSSRIDKYVNGGCVPVLTSAGKTDQYGQWAVYPKVVKHLNDIDHVHYPFWMEELGHTMPATGTDFATGESRYVVFKRFFDRYLKPSDETKADVFCIFPKEGAEKVDDLGVSRMLPADNFLPEYMLGLPTDTPVTVRFLDEFTVDAVSAAVKVTEVETGTPVEGEWKGSMKNTSFSFTPSSPLEKGKTYRITVPTSLASVSGAHPSVEVTRDFTVTHTLAVPENVKVNKILPIDDSYTKYVKGTTPNGEKDGINLRWSTYGDWRFVGYFKFDLSEVNPVRMNKVTVNLALSAAVEHDIKVNFHKTAVDWEEETMVSASKPTMESQYFTQLTVTPSTSWIEVDVTDIVRECIANGEECFSMAANIPNTEDDIYVRLYTKEAANETVRPFMSVESSLPSSPTIHVDREIADGTAVKLIVAADYEDQIESVTWYVDDNLSETDVVTLSTGEHKLKAVVKGPEEVGTDVIIKYVEVK